jgi:hypothetical protein
VIAGLSACSARPSTHDSLPDAVRVLGGRWPPASSPERRDAQRKLRMVSGTFTGGGAVRPAAETRSGKPDRGSSPPFPYVRPRLSVFICG